MTVFASARREEVRRCVICNDERLVWRQSGHFHYLSTVGRKGNRLQRRLAGLYFALQLTKADRTTIDLQNRQNLSSPSRIFASILQVRQAASQINPAIRPVLPSRR